MPKFAVLLVALCSFHCGEVLARAGGYTISPASGETVSSGFDRVEMRFAREVRITKFHLVKLPQELSTSADELSASDYDALDSISKVPRGFITDVKINFDSFTSGIYLLEWSVVARDGDSFSGRSQFTVIP